MSQYGLMTVPVSSSDIYMTQQPVAAGVTAADSAWNLAKHAPLYMEGLEDQVEGFYGLANEAGATLHNIEKFLTGGSCSHEPSIYKASIDPSLIGLAHYKKSIYNFL
jgi:hypothetical protein